MWPYYLVQVLLFVCFSFLHFLLCSWPLLAEAYIFEEGIMFPLCPHFTCSGTVLHDAEVPKSLSLGL